MLSLARTFLVLVFFTAGNFVQAEDAVTVFDVRKPIAMSKTEQTEKDFYINAGAESGIKKGNVVTVVRRMSLYDAYQNKSPGDLVVPIGKLRIIHVQKGMSVGRLYSLIDRENIPVVEFDGIMIGDRLDLGTLTSDSGKKNKEAKAPPEEGPKPEAKLEERPVPKVAVEMGSKEQASSAPKKDPNVNLPTMN